MRHNALIAVTAILLACADADAPAAEESKYKLQPTDVVTITVHGQPDLTTKTRVAADGSITFPLVGSVAAANFTVNELERELKALLEKDYLVNAQVIVFIEEYHPRQVSVMGEVKTPGQYVMPAEKDLSLMEAIALAGGFSKTADIGKVKVVRAEGGKKTTIIVNAKEITEKGNKDKDVVLKPDDIVIVAESFF